METKHPDILLLDWKTDKKDLPTLPGTYCVYYHDNENKIARYGFAQFVPIKFPNCKVDLDEWRILGVGVTYARGENIIDVVAWSKAWMEKIL